MDMFLSRIAKLTASMPDTALPVPVEAPRSITPSQPLSMENFALTAGSALAGWAMAGLKSKVLGSDTVNGEPARSESAPPSQTQATKPVETPSELKGLGSQGNVDAWKDEDDDPWSNPSTRQRSAPTPHVQSLGMKLPAKNKNSVVEQVLEEEQRKSVEKDDDVGAWPELDDWDDDPKDDGWGFDDE
jgi:hypothetical protein